MWLNSNILSANSHPNRKIYFILKIFLIIQKSVFLVFIQCQSSLPTDDHGLREQADSEDISEAEPDWPAEIGAMSEMAEELVEEEQEVSQKAS